MQQSAMQVDREPMGLSSDKGLKGMKALPVQGLHVGDIAMLESMHACALLLMCASFQTSGGPDIEPKTVRLLKEGHPQRGPATDGTSHMWGWARRMFGSRHRSFPNRGPSYRLQ